MSSTKQGITRYAHGFYKFGTMERHPEGDWVKYEDLRTLLNIIQSDASRDILTAQRRHCAADRKVTQLKKWVFWFGLLAVGNLTGWLITLWGKV